MELHSRRFFGSLCLAVLFGPLSGRGAVVDLPVTADTFITSGAPGNNAGGHAWFDAGTDGFLGGNAVRRGLLRFDLSSIPAGSTVTSAEVRLTVSRVPGIGPVDSTFDLSRLLVAWGEGTNTGNAGAPAVAGEATWNARLSGTANWTVAGAKSDAVSTPSASTPVGSTPNATYSWSGTGLTADVQSWVNDPGLNFGWLLTSRDEVSAKSVRGFTSREGTNGPGTLRVGYTPPIGVNVPPSVAITSPANDATFVAGTSLTLQATASDSDGTVTQVEFFDGATSLGTDTTGPDYTIVTTLYTGVHVLTAVARDNQGATTTSVTVTNTGTTVTIADPIAARIPKGDLTVELQTIADGMAAPLGLAVPDDGSGRMFVYDQDGRVWNVTAAGRQATPLLDLRSRLVLLGAYDERGLLGLAVHPNFAANPLLYTYTSEPNGGVADFPNGLGITNNHQSVIAEWRISAANSNVVEVSSRRELLRIDQPQSNHNGGVMHFGPDGKLYIVLGDGGQANDVAPGHVAGGNAQDLNRIWGKLLRIDVDGANSANGRYGIPTDNPFVGADGIDEVWASGLRNPFSFSFERGTGALYLADVGQNKVEEVNVITKGGNYGWNIKEGTFWFDGAGNIVTAPVRPVPPNLIDPIAQYDHDDGLAVIGGAVYHGSAIPALQGRFVFGDWGSFTAPSGRLFYLDAANGVKELRIGGEDRMLSLWLRGYGEGPDGELYLFCSRQLGPTGNTGRMLKIVPAPSPITVASIVPEGGTNLDVVWNGGTGPFAIQSRAALSDPTWINAGFTAQSYIDTPPAGPTAFFRVLDAAHAPPIPLTVLLTGASEQPATNNSAGLGTGILRLDGDTLIFDIAYRNLGSTAGAAHIHGPAEADEAAGVLINLSPFNGGTWGTSGTLSGLLLLTADQKAMILSSRTYVNIHTVGFAGGEIRGQITPVNMQVALSGNNQDPPVSTPASGLGNAALVGNRLTLNVTYRGLSSPALAAHIHSGYTGDPLVDLAPYHHGAFGTAGSFSGTVTLTPDQLILLVDGDTYINIHTAAHPGGELRGTIAPHATGLPLTALLSGLAEQPALTNTAAGAGTFSLEGDTLTFNIVYSGLSGPATASHIHGYTNTAGNAGVLINLAPFNGGTYGASGAVSGSVVLTRAQRNGLLGGLTYVNFHTAANPGGEMRGQIVPVAMFANLSGSNERTTAIATPGTGFGSFALVRDQLALVVSYGGLPTPATAAHIHGPAGFFANAGVMVDLSPYNGGAYGAAGALSGTASLTVSQLLNIVDGNTYVNFHTSSNPGGEMRGQIMR